MDKEHYLHSRARMEANIANGWEFKFGDYISRGFAYTNAQAGQHIGFTVLAFLILFATALIPIAGALASSIFLSSCLIMGMATGVNHYQKTSNSEFNTFWDGFKFIGPISIYGLIMLAIGIVTVLLFIPVIGFAFIGDFMELQKHPTDQQLVKDLIENFMGKGLIIFLIAIILIFLTFPLYLAPFFIVFHGMDPMAAIKASYDLLKQNWVSGAIFFVVAGLIFAIGTAITCGLGSLYLFPAMRNMFYALYEDMTGMDQEAESVISSLDSDLLDG